MDKNGAFERIRFVLDAFEEIDLAYVFGSFLERDDFHDIDVAIHLCKEQSPYERFKLSQRVARDLEKGVEPRVDFDVRILNYARERRIDFEAHLISEYLDLKYMYDRLDKAFLARA
jgi:predicted nucleotidyltransferase